MELDPVKHATGWGADVVAIPQRREAWFSRYEKTAAARLYRFDIETQQIQQIKGLAGELRGAALSADSRRLWLLSTFAVQELDLGTMSMGRTLRAGVGKYLQHLHPLDSDHLGLARMGGRSLAVMQLSRWAIVRRLNIAAPDLICRDADRFIAYSFYTELYRRSTWRLRATGLYDLSPYALRRLSTSTRSLRWQPRSDHSVETYRWTASTTWRPSRK